MKVESSKLKVESSKLKVQSSRVKVQIVWLCHTSGVSTSSSTIFLWVLAAGVMSPSSIRAPEEAESSRVFLSDEPDLEGETYSGSRQPKMLDRRRNFWPCS